MNSSISPAQICCPNCQKWFTPNMQSVIIEAHLDFEVSIYIYCSSLCSFMTMVKISHVPLNDPNRLNIVRKEKIQDAPEKWALYCESPLKKKL